GYTHTTLVPGRPHRLGRGFGPRRLRDGRVGPRRDESRRRQCHPLRPELHRRDGAAPSGGGRDGQGGADQSRACGAQSPRQRDRRRPGWRDRPDEGLAQGVVRQRPDRAGDGRAPDGRDGHRPHRPGERHPLRPRLHRRDDPAPRERGHDGERGADEGRAPGDQGSRRADHRFPGARDRPDENLARAMVSGPV
ncbi:MAG: protein of unknown function DUF305, partial [uncultured Thermomicrobiales bacterium]